jgi:hypothetical protein
MKNKWLETRWFTGIPPEPFIEVAPHVYANGYVENGRYHAPTFEDAQLGMYAMGILTAHVDGSEVDFDPALAEWLIEMTYNTVMNAEAPDEIDLSQRTDEKHCRMCIQSEALDDGTWYCHRFNSEITWDQQERGCPHHKFSLTFLGPKYT